AIDFLLTLGLVGGVRFLVRAVLERPFRGALARKGAREVLIVGAGNGGQLVAAELRRNPDLGVPIGFVDDDPRKQGIRLAGLKVEGTTDRLPRVLDGAEPDEVIIAIPSAPGVLRQKVVTACRERGIQVRTLPTVFELLSGGVELMRQVREVQVEDVLGREPIRVEIDRVGAYLSGQVVLVTGAGGSIGSELCRQIARVGANRFVLVSTDKAVAPTTVRGASKSLAEWALEAAHHRFPQTAFTTVRFGNVLGSSGSVVPIFRRQIAAGGPVTLTDSAMTRYFMTIPEAVQLIIRSGALGTGGDVYVLEMGDPVRIVDLARNMI